MADVLPRLALRPLVHDQGAPHLPPLLRPHRAEDGRRCARGPPPLHARLRLEETIPEDKCDDFIKDLVEKGQYGTAAGEVNFESSEKRFFVEEMLLSELRESRAKRGWLCGCTSRHPIWREGGAYGGCRD